MLIRQLVEKLHCLITDRRSSPRYKHCVPITVTLPPEKNPTANLIEPREALRTSGITKDLSEAGIAFYVSSIRLNEHYLVGEERPLIAKLTLPEGEVTMKIVGVRYERESGNFIELKYLIGARISEMAPAERALYRQFLQRTSDRANNTIQDFSSETPES